MTFRASHVLVRSSQRELGALVMIELRRLPLHAGVAFRAMRHVGLGELLPVNVFVAVFALGRRRLEVRIDELGFEIRGFVAIDASRRPMRPQQRELGLRMIEAGQFLPRFRGVTGFAS